MMDHKISIIVPVYNVEAYVKKSIESIINQTYSNLEIFLIDDGSTDSSGDICEEYAKIDSRITVVHKNNGGQGSARNIGINMAQGDYIMFLDSDDYMQLDCIQKLLELIISNDYDVSVCNYMFVDEEGNSYGNFSDSKDKRELNGYEAIRFMWNDEIINIAPWAKLYKRSLWQDFRFKECYCEDSASMYLFYKDNTRLVYTPEPLVNYVMRKTSDVRHFTEKKLFMLDIYDEVVDYAKREMPDYLVGAAISKQTAVNFHVYFQLPDNEYNNIRKRIVNTIKKNRVKVIFEKKARLKTKLACIMSFFGMKITQELFIKMKKRNPKF